MPTENLLLLPGRNLVFLLACVGLVYKVYSWLTAMDDVAKSAASSTQVRAKNKGSPKINCNNNNSNSGTIVKRKEPPKANLSRKQAGSNWENSKVAASPGGSNGVAEEQKIVRKKVKQHAKKNATKYVAMDCEMVGIGLNGQDDMLARVTIVNQRGAVLLDKYVKPREPVIDYRTKVSGIRPRDIENGEDFEKVQDEVVTILQDKILVGHSIHNDLAVLFIKHPYTYIRDTAKYKPLAKLVANGATPSLKRLAKAILGLDIQDGEHSSVEDARATMSIYNKVSIDWENYLKKKFHGQRQRANRSRS